MKDKFLRATVVASLSLCAALAHGQTHRVSGHLSAHHSVQTEILFPPFGAYSRYDNLGSVWSSSQAVAGLPLNLGSSGMFTDTLGLGMSDVAYNVSSSTDFRNNRAVASLSGFVPVSRSTTETYCPTGGTGSCSGNEFDIGINVSNFAYANTNSTWEEIYYIGGASGIGTLSPTYRIHAKLGPDTAGGGGNAYFSWYQRDFSGNIVLGLTASYSYDDTYDGSGYWNVGQWDSATSWWTWESGTGPLVLDRQITGQVDFEFGRPFYVNSSLSASVNGNGVADIGSTVTLTGLDLPSGALLYVSSGTNYQGVATFQGGYGGFCDTQACALGTGGMPVMVPEPETYALMLAGLGLLGWMARRRNISRHPRA